MERERERENKDKERGKEGETHSDALSNPWCGAQHVCGYNSFPTVRDTKGMISVCLAGRREMNEGRKGGREKGMETGKEENKGERDEDRTRKEKEKNRNKTGWKFDLLPGSSAQASVQCCTVLSHKRTGELACLVIATQLPQGGPQQQSRERGAFKGRAAQKCKT